MSETVRKMIAWGTDVCNSPTVGYSQAYRNQQTVNGITYYDCSSFINYALLAGGFETPSYAPDHNAFTTFTMGAELLRLGWRKVESWEVLKPGDVGVSNNSQMEHTEMVHDVNSETGYAHWMGAHTDGVSLPDQVSITDYVQGKWLDEIYRYDKDEEIQVTINIKIKKEDGSDYPKAHLKVTQLNNKVLYDGDTNYLQLVFKTSKWGEGNEVVMEVTNTYSTLYKIPKPQSFTLHEYGWTYNTTFTIVFDKGKAGVGSGMIMQPSNKLKRNKRKRIIVTRRY